MKEAYVVRLKEVSGEELWDLISKYGNIFVKEEEGEKIAIFYEIEEEEEEYWEHPF